LFLSHISQMPLFLILKGLFNLHNFKVGLYE